MPVASQDALTGFGMSAQMADLLGAQPYAAGAGVGTSQPTVVSIRSKSTEVTPTGGNTAYLLNTFGISEPIFIYNSAASAVTALVFPPSGGTMLGSLNGSVSIAQNKGAWIWQYKKGFWAAVVSA